MGASVKVPICKSIVATPIYYFGTNMYMHIVPEGNYRPYSMDRCGHILHVHQKHIFWKKVQPTSAAIDCHRYVYGVHC